MKKNDVVLGGGILAIALVLFLVMHLTRGEEGNQIQITVDGVVYGTYSLEKNQVIEVKEDDFYNRIRIQDGVAYMEEANCPDGYCEEQGKINGCTQTIVCLPHKLVVEVLDANGLEDDNAVEDMPDTISK
ncbi:NusG domain II-containing protein [Firmicutes bacterium AM43-11BH]|nr:NusG domain II-containing protein [Firmicutes bacterium AM43-11BH]